MSRYAENTIVTSEASRAEIERTLRRYGADGFMYGWDDCRALVAFSMGGRRVQFTLPMPDRNAREFTHTPSRGNRRSAKAADEAYEKSVRQRWRALALVIKAKLEAVESGITVFEEEFLAHLVLPDGQTVGRRLIPRLDEALQTGTLPPLLPGPKQ